MKVFHEFEKFYKNLAFNDKASVLYKEIRK